MDSHSAIDLIRKKSKKLTPQRLAILKALASEKKPLSAKEVFERVQSSQPTIGLDTVYRNLIMLTEKGYVSQVNLQNKRTTLFEFQGEEKHHHHAICVECGGVFCIDACKLPRILPGPDEDPGFKIESHVFEVYGTCSGCQSA